MTMDLKLDSKVAIAGILRRLGIDTMAQGVELDCLAPLAWDNIVGIIKQADDALFPRGKWATIHHIQGQTQAAWNATRPPMVPRK